MAPDQVLKDNAAEVSLTEVLLLHWGDAFLSYLDLFSKTSLWEVWEDTSKIVPFALLQVGDGATDFV